MSGGRARHAKEKSGTGSALLVEAQGIAEFCMRGCIECRHHIVQDGEYPVGIDAIRSVRSLCGCEMSNGLFTARSPDRQIESIQLVAAKNPEWKMQFLNLPTARELL